MKRIILAVLSLCVVVLCGASVSAQNIAGVKNRLSMGENSVSVTEQSDASTAVRTIEQRPRRAKVGGYTILLLSDNTPQARENAVVARNKFCDTFPGIEVEMYYESPSFYVTAGRYLTKEEAIIELWRFRSLFPKAILQSRTMPITDFIEIPKPIKPEPPVAEVMGEKEGVETVKE